ncbi:hypothetical protein [Tahibacter amnicola]|uniref:Uncharacterized protein n=1 Tax=Tahibacter amnicola TaxID=2976241 RepID=A0ABY6BGB3_9GAMM|nr:hypothetical protein [Tahibacter amnicola]UXI68822.1 hypothetical protein N4264_03970 [Tahibacter amnicola]
MSRRGLGIARCLVLLLLLTGVCMAQAPSPQTPLTPEPDRRGVEQTYLTYPEWFLVFSSAEYADFVRSQPPSRFPFIGHVRQFWRGYAAVDSAIRDKYPPNDEYHTMIRVIGVSTSIEYGLRRAYESLIGRLSEATTAYPATDEDQLAARAAQEYVDFIRLRPWYEFDFASRLRAVWTAPWWGKDPLRKWERKYALTTEFAAKALYGWVIRKATHAAYGEARDTTLAVIDHLPDGLETELPKLTPLAPPDERGVLVSLPRYEPFSHYASVLAQRQVRFVEIAGNRSLILVTALTPRGWAAPAEFGAPLFVEPVMTRPDRQRVALQVPVAALDQALRTLSQPPMVLEHVFDY